MNRRSKYLPSAACRRWRPRVSAHANRKPHRGVFRVDTLGPDGATWTNLSLGAALNTRRSFDGLNRLSEISNQPGAASPISFAYTVNAANQRTTNSLADGSRWQYQYNERGEVIAGKKYFSDGTAVQGAQFEYAFDTIGNRTSTKEGTATAESTYTANNLNQYSQRTIADEILVTGSAVTGATVSVRLNTNNAALANRHGEYFWKTVDADNSSAVFFTTNLKVTAYITSGTNSLVRSEARTAILPRTPEAFTWDPDGNLLTDSLWTNSWDANNRMVSTESRAEVPDAFKKRLSFQYDFMGRRTVKQAESGFSGGAYSTTNTTTYVWDGFNIVAEICNRQSVITTNFYTWALDVSGSLGGAGGVGGLVIVSINGTNALPFYNGNGDVMGLVTTSGTIVAEYEYSPVGVLLKCSGPLAKANPFRFSTKPTDDETGLIIYPPRPYSPALQCFLARDPIGEEGGINLHGLCGGDCINRIDPDGLKWEVTRNYDSEADANCDCDDTVAALAQEIKLDPAEFPKWLTAADGKPLPSSATEKIKEARQFKVPNEAHITVGYLGLDESLADKVYVYQVTPYFIQKRMLKYKVVDHTAMLQVNNNYYLGNAMSTITAALGGKNIAVWGHFGHGNLGDNDRPDQRKSSGILIRASNSPDSLGQLHFAAEFSAVLHHKLTEVYIYACGSGTTADEWLRLVAPGGTFYGSANLESLNPKNDRLTAYPNP
jgi:RHS repeat-associated protein